MTHSWAIFGEVVDAQDIPNGNLMTYDYNMFKKMMSSSKTWVFVNGYRISRSMIKQVKHIHSILESKCYIIVSKACLVHASYIDSPVSRPNWRYPA